MRLVLGSGVAPDAPLEELLDAAKRKAVAGLELEVGHGHGVDPGLDDGTLVHVGRAFRDRDLVLAGLRLDDGSPGLERAARASTLLGAPLVLDGRSPVAGELADGGAAVLLDFGDLDAGIEGETLEKALALRARHGGRIGFSWDGRPSTDPSGLRLAAFAAGVPGLSHVRIRGAGPEGGDPEGGSVGAWMARLTLARFGGTCALAPTSDAALPIWSEWLGRNRGWGCNGSRPVQIAGTGHVVPAPRAGMPGECGCG